MFAYDVLSTVSVNLVASVATAVIQNTARKAERRFKQVVRRKDAVSSFAGRVYRKTRQWAGPNSEAAQQLSESSESDSVALNINSGYLRPQSQSPFKRPNSRPSRPYSGSSRGFARPSSRPMTEFAFTGFRPGSRPESFGYNPSLQSGAPEPTRSSTPPPTTYNPYATPPCEYTLRKQRERQARRQARRDEERANFYAS